MVTPPTRLGASEEGDLTAAAGAAARPARPEPAAPVPPAPRQSAAEPVLPSRAAEDTDEAWGERAESPDDARYLREKPPHWQ